LLISAPHVIAQKNEYLLRGYMGVQGGESFHYDLRLKDSVRNILSGYSSTYQNPENDVRTSVVAELDRDGKTLHIRESTIMQNNNFKSRAIICLVEVQLKYSSLDKNLFGTLITMTAGNGANCSKGSISFSNKDEIDHLFNPSLINTSPAAPSSSNIVATPPRKPTKVVYDTVVTRRNNLPALPQTPAPPKQTIITEGQDKTYQWNSDEIVFEIWDGTTVDNDRVTILLNGTEVLKDYVLAKNKKELRLPIGGNELNIISILALNEGSEPPNTANITIKDGDVSYDIMAHNKFGKTALIKIKKKM
jgi:hypothetical protein